MRMTLFGISGRAGEQSLLQAVASGHEVTALVRRPDRFTISYRRLTVAGGDAPEPDSFADAMVGQDAVISALGVTGFVSSLRPMTLHAETTRNIVTRMKARGVRRFVGITSDGVLHDPATPLRYRAIVRPLLRHEHADMREMEEVVRAAGLDWTGLADRQARAAGQRPADAEVPGGRRGRPSERHRHIPRRSPPARASERATTPRWTWAAVPEPHRCAGGSKSPRPIAPLGHGSKPATLGMGRETARGMPFGAAPQRVAATSPPSTTSSVPVT